MSKIDYEQLESLRRALEKLAQKTHDINLSSRDDEEDALEIDVNEKTNLHKDHLIDDEQAYDAVREGSSNVSFSKEIKAAFIKNYQSFGFASNQHDLSESNIEVMKLNTHLGKAKGINSSSHFIIRDLAHNKQYHVKSALHGSGISLGSKFNEIAFYKLNEEMKIGPRCGGILSREGILMIVSEDLGSRSIGNAKNKQVSFSDNEKSIIDGKPIKKDIVSEIPEREKENIHRCVIEIMINLCFYADVQSNYANTGFKETVKNNADKPAEIKRKPFIIDFRLAGPHDLLRKFNNTTSIYEEVSPLNEVKKYADIVASKINPSLEVGPIRKDIFEFEENPKIFQEALKKLFFNYETGEATKFHDAITRSFEYASHLTNQSLECKEEHQSILLLQQRKIVAHINKFLENPDIANFFEQEKEKFLLAKENSTRDPSLSAPSTIAEVRKTTENLISLVKDYVQSSGRLNK